MNKERGAEPTSQHRVLHYESDFSQEYFMSKTSFEITHSDGIKSNSSTPEWSNAAASIILKLSGKIISFSTCRHRMRIPDSFEALFIIFNIDAIFLHNIFWHAIILVGIFFASHTFGNI